MPSVRQAPIAFHVQTSPCRAGLRELSELHLKGRNACNEDQARHAEEHQGPQDPGSTEDRVPANDRSRNAADDDAEDTGDSEKAITADDAVDSVGE